MLYALRKILFTPLLGFPTVLPRGNRNRGSYSPQGIKPRGQVTAFTPLTDIFTRIFVFPINKRVLLKLFAATLIIFAILLVSNNAALAQQTSSSNPAKADYDSAIKGIGKTLMAPAVAIVAAFLWIIRAILNFILSWITVLFEQLIVINADANPGNLLMVQIGWTALRDTANALFLLIMLWVALSIILNFEQLGGKRLLFRVIIVALLINFSLAFVAATFAFSNILAGVFYDKLPRDENGGLAVVDFINRSLLLTTVDTPLTSAELKKMEEASQEIADAQRFIIAQNQLNSGSYAIASALGVGGLTLQKADAAAIALRLVSLLPRGVQLFSKAWKVVKTTALLYVLGAGVGILVGDVYDIAKSLALTNIYLIILISAFVIVGILLITRLIAMAILGVLAPAAFFFLAVPGKFGESFFYRWLDAVFRYAFFTPAFFFLFYLALFVVNEYRETFVVPLQQKVDKINVVAQGAPFLWAYIMSAGFMIASVLVARKMASEGAKLGVGVASKLGTFALGMATGGVALGAGALTRRYAPQLQAGIEKVSGARVAGIPIGRIAAPLLERGDKYIEAQLKKEEDRFEEIKHRSPEQLKAVYQRGSAHDKVAAARALAAQNRLDVLKNIGVDIEKTILPLAQRFGKTEDILKAAPHLATAKNVAGAKDDRDAMTKVLKNVDRKWQVPKEAYDSTLNPHAAEFREALMASLTSGREFAEIARNNRDLMRELMDDINDQGRAAALKANMNPVVVAEIRKYLNGPVGKSVHGGAPSWF